MYIMREPVNQFHLNSWLGEINDIESILLGSLLMCTQLPESWVVFEYQSVNVFTEDLCTILILISTDIRNVKFKEQSLQPNTTLCWLKLISTKWISSLGMYSFFMLTVSCFRWDVEMQRIICEMTNRWD